MSINKINTTQEEQNFKFLKNQSSVSYTTDTNNIAVNGVNVFVNKPKKGDVMCVTRYTDESGNQLPADKQKVLWIDGLSIAPNQISTEIEPIGICLYVDGNKAMVKYKTDDSSTNRQFRTSNDVTFDTNDVEPYCYLNNGFSNKQQTPDRHAGCCRAWFYQKAQASTAAPNSEMLNIFQIPNRDYLPVRKEDFDKNDYCRILRDTFTNYDEYFDSMMIKIPCGKGTVGKFPSGKYITYKLAGTSYPLLNWAAKINVNASNLGAGNWWVPSVAEMGQIMNDITYGTNFWETNPDIVNRVLYKLTNANTDTSEWHMISASSSKWTSSLYGSNSAFIYDANRGAFNWNTVYWRYEAMAITIYEF